MLFYNARWYDPAIGRFIQADSIVPNPGNPQSLNRYTYANNSPLTYIDRDGHIAFIPLLIVGVIVASKAIDYGWTAYDAAQSLKVMNDPNATEADKAAAAANLALAAAFEAAEPDDFLPIALPLDDLARRGIIAGGKKVAMEASEQAAKSVDRVAFGLGRPRGTIGRFAQKVDAATYWDLYENTSDLNVMGKQLLDMMNGSQEIHFNLDGMIGKGQTIHGIAKIGQEGLREGNITNWELYTILTNQDFFRKAIFAIPQKSLLSP